MRPRTENSADNALIKSLIDLRTDVDALRATQLVGGAQVVGYLLYTTDPADSAISVPAGAKVNYVLTFTSDVSPYLPLVNLYLFYSLQPLVLKNPVPPYTASANVSLAYQELVPDGKTNQWFISLTNTTGLAQTAYLKFIFNSSAKGAWALASV